MAECPQVSVSPPRDTIMGMRGINETRFSQRSPRPAGLPCPTLPAEHTHGRPGHGTGACRAHSSE